MSATFNGWATVDPNDSSGNKTTVWTASAHTGRNSRSVSVLYKSKNTATTITRNATVTQTGAQEFVSITTAGGAAISANSVTRTNTQSNDTFAIAGTSNASGLKFQIIPINDEPTSWVTLASSFTGDGNTINLVNGAGDIPGDPGASSAYGYSISVTLAPNTTISSRSVTFRVSSKTNQSIYQEITITQSAGDPYLRINTTNSDPGEQGQTATTSITIAANGGTANIYTFSNCEWEVVAPIV